MSIGAARKSAWLALACTLVGCALSGARPLPDGATACGEPRPQVCTMDYNPVCGLRPAAERRSYGNACGACADPAVVAHVPGTCEE